MPQVGPITMWVSSTTRSPASGCGIGAAVVDAASAVAMAHGGLPHRLRQAGTPERAMQRLALEPAGDAAAQCEQRVEVDAGRLAHAGEQIGDVFGGDVAAGARRMRTAADAREAGVEAAHAGLPGGHHVGQAEAARVVEVAAAELVAGDLEGALEELADHLRIGVADGVGQADAVDAGVEHGAQQAQHFLGLDAALDRAAEGGAEADLDAAGRAGRVAGGADLRDLSHHVVGRLAQVGEAVRMARRQRQQHQVGVAGDGTLGSFQVRHQDRDHEAGQGASRGDELGGVGQLRQEARRHERADLDLAQPGGMGAAQPFELQLRGQDAGDALQSIAQPDLANHDAGFSTFHARRL